MSGKPVNAGPPQPQSGKSRSALGLNLLFPGAGLIVTGYRQSGYAFAIAFGLCFVAILALFVVGYARYILVATSPDILKGNELEKIGEAFRPAWFLGLLLSGLIIYVASTITLLCTRRRGEQPPGGFGNSQSP